MYNYGQYYYYTYEASLAESIQQIHLSEGYELSSIIIAFLLGLLAFAFFLLAAIFVRKGRVFGIITATFQPLGFIASSKIVTNFAAINFECLNVTATGSSEEAAMSNLVDILADRMVEQTFPSAIPYIVWSIAFIIFTIMTIIYTATLFGAKGKGLAVFSFILVLIRFAFLNPVEMVSWFFNFHTPEIQSIWDIIFRIIIFLPPLFIGILGLCNIKKDKNAVTEPSYNYNSNTEKKQHLKQSDIYSKNIPDYMLSSDFYVRPSHDDEENKSDNNK